MPRKHVIKPEIKQQILERVKQGDKPITQIAAEHGISTNTIYKWIGHNTTASPSLLEFAKLRKENQMLKELLGQITYEMSQSKKKEYGR